MTQFEKEISACNEKLIQLGKRILDRDLKSEEIKIFKEEINRLYMNSSMLNHYFKTYESN